MNKHHENGSPNNAATAVEPGIRSYFSRKTWLMRGAAVILLIPATPVIALSVGLVRLTSSGPGLFRQRRVGKDGKPFTMYKIRTMYEDAEALSGPVWCQPADSRITPVGRCLRFLHLDELPQLANVAKGDMCLVGPRPERPEFVARLNEKIPGYALRHTVLPGITGLAQINLPADTSVDCVRRKLALDVEYIQTASLLLDLRALVCTALRMLGVRHGRAVRWMRVQRYVAENESRYLVAPIGQDENLAADADSLLNDNSAAGEAASLKRKLAFAGIVNSGVSKHQSTAGDNLPPPARRRVPK